MSIDNMLDAVEELDKRFNDGFFNGNIGREISQLREALESGDEDAINEALGETVDGCDTALARLLGDVWWIAQKFSDARDAYEQPTVDAINDFENTQ